MKSVTIAIQLALAGLLMAMVSTIATAQVTDAPANATSVLGDVNASIVLIDGANVTIETDATLVNATAFSLSASANVTAFNSSSIGNYSLFSSNATEGVSNETIAVPEYDFSNFTANELIELLNVSSLASLTLEFEDLIARANVTLQSLSFNASVQYDNETITFPPSRNNSVVNGTTQSVGALNLNTSTTVSNETITFLSVQNASFSVQSVQVSDVNSSSSSSGSGSSSAEVAASIETEILEPASTTHVISHVWEAVIASVISALRESTHLAASEQFQPATTETETVTQTETISVKASAPTSESTTGATGPETAWVPTVAAVGAVVVVVGAALFGYQKRQRRDYNVLSPGSAALSSLTPPRALNV